QHARTAWSLLGRIEADLVFGVPLLSRRERQTRAFGFADRFAYRRGAGALAATRRSPAGIRGAFSVWWTVPKCSIRNSKGIFALRYGNGDVRGHPGLQFVSRIFDRENHTVGHNILNSLRAETDFCDLSFEHFIRISVDCERDVGAFGNVPDVGFIDA